MEINKFSAYPLFDVGDRFMLLGKCSRCMLYPKCRGIKLLCNNPNDNPKNPRKNPDNPIKEII